MLRLSREPTRILYEFKLVEMKTNRICGLVKEDSKILEYICKGEVLNMNYYTIDRSRLGYNADTKVRKITREQSGRFKGHCLIGLEIVSEMLVRLS